MANARLIHLTPRCKEHDNLAAKTKQKKINSYIFGSNPSISHEIWRLPDVYELHFLLAAQSGVRQLFE